MFVWFQQFLRVSSPHRPQATLEPEQVVQAVMEFYWEPPDTQTSGPAAGPAVSVQFSALTGWVFIAENHSFW